VVTDAAGIDIEGGECLLVLEGSGGGEVLFHIGEAGLLVSIGIGGIGFAVPKTIGGAGLPVPTIIGGAGGPVPSGGEGGLIAEDLGSGTEPAKTFGPPCGAESTPSKERVRLTSCESLGA
jgi:hypothetical protein